MDKIAIKALIDKYQIVQVGDKLRTYVRGVDPKAFAAEVGANKDEILQYFAAERQAAQAKAAAKKATFDAIPGVPQLREARQKSARWNAALNRMMETGSSKMDTDVEHFPPQQLAALEAQYPLAVFALDAEYRAGNTQNLQMRTVWLETYNALCAGQDPAAVKAEHDARMRNFVNAKMFD